MTKLFLKLMVAMLVAADMSACSRTSKATPNPTSTTPANQTLNKATDVPSTTTPATNSSANPPAGNTSANTATDANDPLNQNAVPAAPAAPAPAAPAAPATNSANNSNSSTNANTPAAPAPAAPAAPAAPTANPPAKTDATNAKAVPAPSTANAADISDAITMIPTADLKTILPNGYKSAALTMNASTSSTSGFVILNNADSKALYSALKLKADTKPGDATLGSASVKNGLAVSCTSQATKAKPTQPTYSCQLMVEYALAHISPLNNAVEADASVPALKKSYSTAGLQMDISGQFAGEAVVKLSGADAKTLYGTIQGDVVQLAPDSTYQTVNEKLGDNDPSGFACFEGVPKDSSKPKDYSCTLQLDNGNGGVAGDMDDGN